MMLPRIPRPLQTSLAFLALCTAGCNRASGPDLKPEVDRLTSELEATRLELETLKKDRSVKSADAAVISSATAPKAVPASSTSGDAQKDAQISALQTEVAELKKRDVFAYVSASAAMQAGGNSPALERYQQFLKDFPNSPLAADADRAIAELTTSKEREARARTMLIDPRRPERDVLQRFTDGTATLQEMTPLLKNRSQADVIKLLGAPTQTFRDGREIGYVDRILDPATGGKGTLVIGFEDDVVANLRNGYLGKPVKP